MVFRDKPDDLAAAAEEYELEGNAQDNDPLLPRYEARPSSPSVRSKAAIRRRLSPCKLLCIVFGTLFGFLAVISIGAVCFASPSALAEWDRLPPSLKEWLNTLIPDIEEELKDNADFPTNVGYAGPTPTGSEAALLATATKLPMYTAVAPLVPPPSKSEGFSIIQHWGNLSPYHSVKSHGLPDSSQIIPQGCELDEMHWLQRHGARYPTSSPRGPAGFAMRIDKAKGWKASSRLEFLNDWSYKLGAELLTPFGRSQLYNLGVAARVKYGFLLDRFEGRLPVLRTESQDRMLRSAQNWAAGFFGIPDTKQHNLEVMIEAPGFNCSLAPYHSCPNDRKVYGPTQEKLAQWDAVFLKKARKRIQKQITGYELSFTDVKEMMDMCAYETVALGHSAFCSLFTVEEWKGYGYRSDIYWWYAASFGSPVARAEGLGWLQELTARLTHTPLTTFNSSTNSTLHDKVHFPVNDPMYIDFTHDTTFAQLLPTLNLTTFSAAGPPPLDHIPKDWPFLSAKFCPFATNLQVQVLTCSDSALNRTKTQDEGLLSEWWPFNDDGDDDEDEDTTRARKRDDEDEDKEPVVESGSKSRYVRLILNDAPVPLTGVNGCKQNDDGLCALDSFVSSMQTLIGEVDFDHDCRADYEYDADDITDGRPVRR